MKISRYNNRQIIIDILCLLRFWLDSDIVGIFPKLWPKQQQQPENSNTQPKTAIAFYYYIASDSSVLERQIRRKTRKKNTEYRLIKHVSKGNICIYEMRVYQNKSISPRKIDKVV